MKKIQNIKRSFETLEFCILNLFRISDFGFRASRKGFTALEIVVAVGIITILGALSLISFMNSRRIAALATTGNEVLAILRLAQEKAVAGQGEDPWGVRLENGVYYIFQGSSYADAVSTTAYTLPSSIEIANITLVGGGQEVVFRPIDGMTDQTGTFTVRVRASTAQVFDVTVDRSGRAYQTGTAPAAMGARVVDARHRTFAFAWGIDDATDVRFSFSDPTVVQTVAMIPVAPRASYDSGELIFAVGGFDQIIRVHALSVASGATTLSIDRDCRKNTKKVVIAVRDADTTFKDIATYEADCRTVTVGAYGGVMSEP